jgi:hypothetical protein
LSVSNNKYLFLFLSFSSLISVIVTVASGVNSGFGLDFSTFLVVVNFSSSLSFGSEPSSFSSGSSFSLVGIKKKFCRKYLTA